MRLAIIAVTILLFSGLAFAVVGGGDVTLKTKKGNVLFSHEVHVGASGGKCQGCHQKLYINTKRHKTITMKEMEKGKSCGACHNGEVAFNVKGDCERCHQK